MIYTAPIGLVYHCSLDLVARYADLQSLPTHTLTGARAGSIAVAFGPPFDVMTRENIQEAYDMDVELVEHNGRRYPSPDLSDILLGLTQLDCRTWNILSKYLMILPKNLIYPT